jgi:thymidylate kinase
MLIVIEGLDGTGKSTIAKALASSINAKLLSTPGVEFLETRKIMDQVYENNPLARQLYYASTVVYLSERLKDLMTQGEVVVIDRYWLSTMVYHHWKCGGKPFLLKEVEDIIQKPDLTIYLNLPMIERALRINNRLERTKEDGLSLVEEVDVNLDAVYHSYRHSALVGRWVEVDASLSVNDIVGHIKSQFTL